jgi:flagellar basal body-associated protein FliL
MHRRDGFAEPHGGYESGMEIGAFFILVILLVVLAVLGGGVYLIAAWLRHKQLDPEGDKVEGPTDTEQQARPEHVEVDSEQHARFVGTR